MFDALTSGLLAGYGIAVPVGAIGVLIVTVSAQVSLRHGAAAGLGVATADGLYALAAVVAGTTVARLLDPAIDILRAAAAVALAAIAVRGIVVATGPIPRWDRSLGEARFPSAFQPWAGQLRCCRWFSSQSLAPDEAQQRRAGPSSARRRSRARP